MKAISRAQNPRMPRRNLVILENISKLDGDRAYCLLSLLGLKFLNSS